MKILGILAVLLGAFLLFTSTRECGPVAAGKDPHVALTTGDTVPAAQQDGGAGYSFQCTQDVGSPDIGFLLFGLAAIAGGAYFFLRELRKERAARAEPPVAGPGTRPSYPSPTDRPQYPQSGDGP